MSHRSIVRTAIGTLMMLAVTPLAANAQFGRLKKMKNSVSPESAAGLTEADARAIAAFQQDMMQVAMAASNGDVAAQARLDRWQAITVKYEPEIQKLSASGSAGNMAAVQRLHAIQIEIIKEWANTASSKPVKLGKPASKQPVKPETPS